MNHLNLDKKSFLREVNERKKRYVIDGKNFPLPRKYHDKIFYDYSESISSHKYKKDRIRSNLYAEALAFERAEYLASFGAQLRKNSKEKLNALDYSAICKILEDEETSLEVRIENAKEYYYSSIKKEKI